MKNQLLFCVMFFSLSLIAQNGLQAEYYDGTNFNRLVETRIDREIDMYWNNTPPVRGIDPHECSIRWTGRLKAPETGVYTFSARVDDGIRVWVGGQQVINDWGLNDVGIFSGKIKMEAGKFYELKVEYFNALIEGEITLLWELPKEEESWFDSWFNDNRAQVIPTEYLFQPVAPERTFNLEEHQVSMQSEEEEASQHFPAPVKPKKPAAKPTPIVDKPAPAKKVVNVDTIQKYIPENIHFERAKTDILPESIIELDELAEFLLKYAHLKVSIEGHTDYVGDAYKNVILSQDRADAVAAYLAQKGVDRDRLSAKGYGGSEPLVKNDGRKYHPENRRVEFVIE